MTLFDDSYTGPRWRYGSRLRPHMNLWWDKWIIWSDRAHPDYATFGTMDSSEEIPAAKVKQWDLVLVETIA